MSDEMEAVLERLSALSESGDQMSIPDIVEAVVGGDSDEELVELARAAFQNIGRPLKLLEMAEGILALRDWRVDQA
ncbi:MAG: hypothetical protein CL386_10920 [Acidiferrobacter sp.]|nr:hypothetical protein [Acidiferrobacter sp.]|tara:strand:+ start:210 stop:437 length:228 start_codon:yes stop_codon:yes gene_type:complete